MKYLHPKYEAPIGSTWVMDNRNGCWAFVLCLGERRPTVGNYPCLVLDCSKIGWSRARAGSVINVALGCAKAWKRIQ